jgi:2-keto-4-pentenoate hydratase
MIDAQEIADILIAAERERRGIAQISDDHPDVDVATAYRAQQLFVQSKLDAGETFVGYKLGLTSEPMQRMLGVDSPDFAPVLASHVHRDGATVRAAQFIAPKVEAEIALVLRDALKGPDCDEATVAAAVGAARPAIEIVDSRIRDWRIKLADTVADLASSGAVVLGDDPTTLDGSFDLRLVGLVFRRDGTLVATGAGAAALGSPFAAVAWLVNTLHSVGGSLSAGQFVMTGALHAAVGIAPGERYTAEFDRLGAVALNCG